MPATASVLVECAYEARLSPGPGVRSIPVPWDGRLQKLHREESNLAALREASDESLISSNFRLSDVKFQTSNVPYTGQQTNKKTLKIQNPKIETQKCTTSNIVTPNRPNLFPNTAMITKPIPSPSNL